MSLRHGIYKKAFVATKKIVNIKLALINGCSSIILPKMKIPQTTGDFTEVTKATS